MGEKRYKRGDVREDGMVFWGYLKRCKNGERWLSVEKFADYREKLKARQRERRKDPEYREKQNARDRERYASDPKFRKKEKIYTSASVYTSDPKFSREDESTTARALCK